MKELVGNERDSHTGVLASVLRESSDSSADPIPECQASNNTQKTILLADEPKVPVLQQPIIIDETTLPSDVSKRADNESSLIEIDDLEVKKEELEGGKKFLIFTTAEDAFLKAGIEKYANSNRMWADILKDDSFEFQHGRSRDSLRVRATTKGLLKSKPKRKGKSK